MNPYLLVDFGSTYTKLTCVDLENEYIIGTSKAPTTVETDVLDGYDKAFKYLLSDHPEIKHISGISACSSAAGGLKMAAIGLVEELTVEAAKRACLGAGAIVKQVYSHHLTNKEAQELKVIISNKHDFKFAEEQAAKVNANCELYLQPEDQPHHSTGVYSITNNKWVVEPKKVDADIDKETITKKYNTIIKTVNEIKKCDDEDIVKMLEKLKDKLKAMRQSGLDSGGEFSNENIVFKLLRRNDIMEQINDMLTDAYDKSVSLD